MDADTKKPAHHTGGIRSYRVGKQVKWAINIWVEVPGGGPRKQVQKGNLQTREQAVLLAAKIRQEAFEGRWFNQPKSLTIKQVWEMYKPAGERNDSSNSDKARAEHLLRHLGPHNAEELGVVEVDGYREARLAEVTRKGTPPSPAQLDREVELLKRMVNYALAGGKLSRTKLTGVKLLGVPNVREVVVTEAEFRVLLEAAEAPLRPILTVAFDTGMRKQSILRLKWSQVDLKTGCIRLAAQDVKQERAMVIPMTSRVLEALRAIPRRLGVPWVFVSEVQKPGEPPKPWNDLGWMFHRATTKAGLPDLWFHDLRRSFVTKARRQGIPETVVMRLSGHRTHAVFERYNIVQEDDLHAAVKLLEQPVTGVGGWNPVEPPSEPLKKHESLSS